MKTSFLPALGDATVNSIKKIIMVALVALIHSMLRASSYLMLLTREREIYEQKG